MGERRGSPNRERGVGGEGRGGRRGFLCCCDRVEATVGVGRATTRAYILPYLSDVALVVMGDKFSVKYSPASSYSLVRGPRRGPPFSSTACAGALSQQG